MSNLGGPLPPMPDSDDSLEDEAEHMFIPNSDMYMYNQDDSYSNSGSSSGGSSNEAYSSSQPDFNSSFD